MRSRSKRSERIRFRSHSVKREKRNADSQLWTKYKCPTI